jgi:hypothetical protein
MSDARTKQIQEIEGLLAERRKYEQWLAQLEARKEGTPDHVFVKVHRDYAARLADAQQRLSSESGAVRALATELGESLAKQEREIAERTDERAEAELRASVGEFAGKEWDKLRAKLDGAIAELTRGRDGVQRELDTLRALLSEAAPAAGGEPKRDVDDIAFLRLVLGRTTPLPTTPHPTTPVPAAAGPPATRAEAASAPAVEPPAAADLPRAPTPAPAASAAPRQPAPEPFSPNIPDVSAGPRGTDDERLGRPSGTFGQPTPRSSEALKSLKCQECGALNYPTEWYCERCGGELAAL